jgi:hypothetical protein
MAKSSIGWKYGPNETPSAGRCPAATWIPPQTTASIWSQPPNANAKGHTGEFAFNQCRNRTPARLFTVVNSERFAAVHDREQYERGLSEKIS